MATPIAKPSDEQHNRILDEINTLSMAYQRIQSVHKEGVGVDSSQLLEDIQKQLVRNINELD